MAENKVSVIVPVYKVENFIARCARSLLGQTLADGVEFIFVDDCSPDDSMKVLKSVIEEYPYRKGQIKVLVHDENLGLPAARNTGLSVSSGEYIFHCDSDDYVESDMLEKLVAEAERKDADIVWCDWFLTFEKRERYMKQPSFSTSYEALQGMLCGTMKYNVWNKIARRSLYSDNGISFPEGYGMGEDMTMIRLFSCARTAVYLPMAFYHYVKLNSTAFSNTYSLKHLEELRYNVALTSDYLMHKFGDRLNDELAFFKLNVKYPFLISDDYGKYALWQEWYPEANQYIMKNKAYPLRGRILQWCAWKGMFRVLKLYYRFVHVFVYGVLFK